MHKKILFVIDSLTGGGSEKIITQVAMQLDPTVYDVKIALTLGCETVQHVEKHIQIIILPHRVISYEKIYREELRFERLISFLLFCFCEIGRHDLIESRNGYIELKPSVATAKPTAIGWFR